MRTELIVGVVSGALIGAAAGILLAPRSGRATRGALKDQIGRMKYRVTKNGEARRLNLTGNRQ